MKIYDDDIPLLPTPTTMDALPVRTPEQIRKIRQIAGGQNLREVIVYLELGMYEEVYESEIIRCSYEEYKEQS